MAFETRYDVSTQVLSSLLAPTLPAMCGKATLAMLVSSTSMNAAMATTIATSHGLNFGVQVSVGAATVHLFDIHFRIHRQAGPQTMIAILARIEIDANRHPLHHLHIIPSCVLRRQQAETRSAGAADLLNRPFVLVAVGIHTKLNPLARLHAAELRFLEIRDDPDIVQWDHCQQLLAR